MNKKAQNEKGAIIIEVIAVIALLGVLGPLLFKQVLSRNEEVDNINLASEMRSLKEAFSAYILTNKQSLKSAVTGCQQITSAALVDYLPYGVDEIATGYDYLLCAISSDVATAPTFLQGFIVPTNGVVPEDTGLKRSARIATLIGADGGIYQNGAVNGTGGAWGIDAGMLDDLGDLRRLLQESNPSGITYLATTGMDTYVPEYIVEDYSSGFVTIPDSLVFQQFHAGNYFAVGGDGNCYEKKHNTIKVSGSGYTTEDDIIKQAGTDGCDPLFWVGTANGPTGGVGTGGHVYVKNGLEVGHTSLISSDYSDTVSGANTIEVFDNTGTQKVLINGKGEIVVTSSSNKLTSDGYNRASDPSDTSDTAETLTIADGVIKSNIKSEKLHEILGGDYNYQLDPADTSVMRDIRLETRGGARLSEILPNYISKEVKAITGSETPVKVDMPYCPSGYAPAIIVIPVSWENVKITNSDLTYSDAEDSSITKYKMRAKTEGAPVTVDVTETPQSGENSHTHSVAASASVSDNTGVYLNEEIIATTAGLVVKIESQGIGNQPSFDAGDGYQREKKDTYRPDAKWAVSFYYPDDDTDAPGASGRTDVKAIAQTYCVYDTSSDS